MMDMEDPVVEGVSSPELLYPVIDQILQTDVAMAYL